MNLEIHPLALREYEDAADWYVNISDRLASRFTSEVEETLTAIRRHPEQFARLDSIHYLCLLSRFPYYVVHRLLGESVVIVTLRHRSQRQDVWQTR